MNCLLAIQFLMNDSFISSIDWYSIYHPRIRRVEFTFDNYPGNSWIDFRFRKLHLLPLLLAFGFGINEIIRVDNGCKFSSQMAFMFFLNRIASLKTLIEQESFWHREYTELSRLDALMIDRIYDQFGWLVTRNLEFFVTRFPMYRDKVQARIVPAVPVGCENVGIFTDATVLQIKICHH